MMDTGGMMYVFILARKNVSMKLLQVHSVEIQGFFCHSILCEIQFVNFVASNSAILILSDGQTFTFKKISVFKNGKKIANIKIQNLRNNKK